MSKIVFERVEDDQEHYANIRFEMYDSMTIDDMVQQFRLFLLAIGYHPDNVSYHIESI
jgi:hypothetical protein